MRKTLIAAALLAAAVIAPARATLFDGYMAECTAVSAGSCTELTGAGYSRQAVSFSDAVRGVTVNSVPYTFGIYAAGTIAGRALYDAATGGNLVAVIPLATAITTPPVDQGDVGTLRFTVNALTGYQNAKPYMGTVAAAATLGTTPDGSTVTAGVKGVFRSGTLTAAIPSFDASYVGPQTLTTGFAVASLTNQATFALTGAGTLATGALTLPTAPLDGQSFRLACQVTVTALTVTAPGKTLSGSVTTCGPSVGHEWVYMGGTVTTWFLLF